MKSVFPMLLCYVFLTSQTFAISGGPIFGGSRVSTIGIYSGVIQGVSEITNPTDGGAPPIPGDPIGGDNGTGDDGSTPSNALGLFTLTVPATLLATGTFLLFSDGVVFSGTINASADPDNGQVKGILEGTFDFSISTFDGTGALVSVPITATAVGRINARVGASAGRNAVSLARLNGTANLDVSFGTVDPNTLAPVVDRAITFTVTGFKQGVGG